MGQIKAAATFTPGGMPWELCFLLKKGGEGILVEARARDVVALAVSRGEMLCARITALWDQNAEGQAQTLQFCLTSPRREGMLRIVWYGFSVRLYVDGKLEDEEWPLGEPVGETWELFAADEVSGLTCSAAGAYEEEEETVFTGPFQNYVPPGHNTGVGDCMPFARDGRYCLYYLFDRRGHASKCGLGAHQWAQVSSADLKSWTVHPMAVGITEQWEDPICTGSLIQKDGRIYAFYAARMSDKSPARLTWAVSPDGVHFEKSGIYFALTEPYEPVTARDPMVFLGADGQYHMLATTSLEREKRFGGCLAHLTSTDLEHWTQQEPFLAPGYADQPECSDYFEWNGWYYLVFSNFAVARYRMSRSPFGPWIRPVNDLLDSLEVQVPRTAAFGERRLCTGFLARRHPRTYAGNAVTHELFQRPDGTLGIKQAEEILPAVKKRVCPKGISLDAGQNRAAAPLPAMEADFRLKASVEPGKENMLMGFLLTLETENGQKKESYRIEMDPAAGTVAIIRPGEDFGLGSGRDLLTNVDLSGEIQIDLLVLDDILDLMLSDGRGMAMRLDSSVRAGSQVEFYALSGALNVSRISLETF